MNNIELASMNKDELARMNNIVNNVVESSLLLQQACQQIVNMVVLSIQIFPVPRYSHEQPNCFKNCSPM